MPTVATEKGIDQNVRGLLESRKREHSELTLTC